MARCVPLSTRTVTDEFEKQAEDTYQALGIQDPTLSNVWHVFCTMLPLLFP